MLVGMAGFLVMGLAIPHAFGRDGVALGIGYLIVVVVHAWLYQRVNANIARVAPFNLAAALLIIGAGVAEGWAAYVLWAAALAVEQVLSPLFTRVRGRFDIQPSHFTERHGALLIVVFGESVVDIGLGAEGHAVTVSLVAVGGAGAGAGRRAVVGLLRRRRRRAGRAGHAARGPGGAPGAGPGRLLLRLYPHAARRRRPGLGGQAGHRQHRAHPAGRAVRGPGLRGGAVPGRQRGVPARAADRAAVPRWPRRPYALAASAVGVAVSVAAEIALLTLIVAAALAAEAPRRSIA